MWTAAPHGETPELETDEACSVAPNRDNLIRIIRKFPFGCCAGPVSHTPRVVVCSDKREGVTEFTKSSSDADMELSLDLVVVCT